MKIEFNKSEIEELIISLIFTNFIKEQNGQVIKNPHLLKFMLEEAYKQGYTDLVVKKDDQIFVLDSVFEKAVCLVAVNNGESTDNLSKTIEEANEEYRKQLLN